MARGRKAKIDPSSIVRIVGDGFIAVQDAYGGAGIPVLVLDCAHRPEIAEAIRVSEFEPDGDVFCQWGFGTGWVGLNVDLVRPAPTSFLIYFELATQGILVETALSAGLVQIKAGDENSSFKAYLNAPGLYVEVPSSEDFSPWPAVFVRALMERFRREGMKSLQARKAAEQAYQSMLAMTRVRLPQGEQSELSHDGDLGPS